MKALAIDSSVSKLTVAVKNDEWTVTSVYDVGMRQSELLLQAIDDVVKKAEISVNDLDYLALCSGPGSWTSLRLSYSALKAVQMATKKPIYGIPTLDVFAKSYLSLPFIIVPCIDAKKERFYAKAFENNEIIIKDGDYTVEEIEKQLDNYNFNKNILICGPSATLLKEKLKQDKNIFSVPFNINTTDCLFAIAEEKISNGDEPIKDFDAPLYIRPSEAETKKCNQVNL